MSRTRFIEHKGVKILLLDYTNLREQEPIFREIEASKAFIASLPKRKELRTLTDVTGSMYNSQILGKLKDLAAHNAPYVEAAAVVTTSGLHKIAIMAVAAFSRRNLQAFATIADAREWLVIQKSSS